MVTTEKEASTVDILASPKRFNRSVFSVHVFGVDYAIREHRGMESLTVDSEVPHVVKEENVVKVEEVW